MTEGWDAEDPFDAEDWEGDFEPSTWLRRRPKIVRVVGAVTAASLLLATMGTTVAYLLDRSTASLFATSVNSVEPASSSPNASASASEIERVQFTIEGDAGADPLCAITVYRHGQAVGSTVQHAPSSGSAERFAQVALSTTAFAGTPADASVLCANSVSALEGSGAG